MVLLNSVAVFQAEADDAVQERQKGKNLKNQSRARTSDLIITLRDQFVFAVLCGHPMFTDSEVARIFKPWFVWFRLLVSTVLSQGFTSPFWSLIPT